jgi:hypothetical protein
MQVFAYSTIQINYQGKIVISSHHGYLQSEFDALKTSFKIQGGTLSPGDKVYFSKFSNVPRYKFNEYAKVNNMSRVITVKNCTAIAMDDTNVFASVSRGWTRDMKKVHKRAFAGFTNHATPDYLWIYPQEFGELVKKFGPTFSSETFEDHKVHNVYSYDVASVQDTLNEIEQISTSGKKIVFDDVILGEINQGVEITTEVYDELKRMFGSTNHDDTALGMEIMANSDYKKSELKIALLLNQYWGTRIGTHKNRNLVNFKSMLKYFEDYGWNKDPIRFAEGIIKTTRDDMPDKDERIELARSRVLDVMQSFLPSSMFKVENIVIKHDKYGDKKEAVDPQCSDT